MTNKYLLSIAAVVLVIISAVAFYSVNSQDEKEKISVIRIGSTAPGHLKYILFEQKGWMEEEFAKDGIKVEYYPFTGGGSEAMVALSSGSLDFAYTGADPALRTTAKGADIKLVALSSFGNPFSTSSIIVRNDSQIKSIKDLKGKKVAYLKGTMRHATIIRALKSEGMSLSDIESLNLNFEASGPALIRGDIDALVESESTAFELISKGVAKIAWNGKDHPEIMPPPSTVTVRRDFAARHPDIVKRVLKIDLKTAMWAEEHPDETIKVFANATKRKEEIVRKQYPKNTFYVAPDITDKAIQSLKDEEDFMRENDLLQGKVDYNSWVDRSFLDTVLKESDRK